MLFGKRDVALGVVGRSFTDVCGDRDRLREAVGVDTVSKLLSEADEALESEWPWWMLRTEEMEDDVDFRPRSPDADKR
jgi:hypothetical protein